MLWLSLRKLVGNESSVKEYFRFAFIVTAITCYLSVKMLMVGEYAWIMRPVALLFVLALIADYGVLYGAWANNYPLARNLGILSVLLKLCTGITLVVFTVCMVRITAIPLFTFLSDYVEAIAIPCFLCLVEGITQGYFLYRDAQQGAPHTQSPAVS